MRGDQRGRRQMFSPAEGQECGVHAPAHTRVGHRSGVPPVARSRPDHRRQPLRLLILGAVVVYQLWEDLRICSA